MTIITLDEFRQIKGYVHADISRELQLARVSDTFKCYLLDFLGISRGGGNMMAAITLLEYTEFAGHIYAQFNNLNNYDAFSVGFSLLIPSDYKKLPQHPSEIHKILRSSLVNPTNDPRSVMIGMLENNFNIKHQTNAGIATRDEIWYFCIEKYYQDLMDVLNNIERKYLVMNL